MKPAETTFHQVEKLHGAMLDLLFSHPRDAAKICLLTALGEVLRTECPSPERAKELAGQVATFLERSLMRDLEDGHV